MSHKRKSAGFSLTEVLMAVGILGVGMLFIAGTFPVAIHFNTVATERTKAALAADEAFAKIKLYGLPKVKVGLPPVLVIPIPFDGCVDFNDVWYQYALLLPNPALRVNPGEFVYPSADIPLAERQYRWSALCRRVSPLVSNRNVQVTVFVSRRTGPSGGYWDRDAAGELTATALTPVPVWVEVTITPDSDEVLIIDANPNDGIYEKTLINAGCTIVDNKTGQLYRVLERYAAPDDDRIILLDRRWLDSDGSGIDAVWVIPPAVGGGRYPCVAVYQRVMRF